MRDDAAAASNRLRAHDQPNVRRPAGTPRSRRPHALSVEHEETTAPVAQNELVRNSLVGRKVQTPQRGDRPAREGLQLDPGFRLEGEAAGLQRRESERSEDEPEHGVHSTILSRSSSRSVQNLGTSLHSLSTAL